MMWAAATVREMYCTVELQLRHGEPEKYLGAPFVHLASRVFNDSLWLSQFFSILGNFVHCEGI